MSLWGSNAAAVSNAPKFTVLKNIAPGNTTVNNTTMYGNTTPGAFIPGQTVGLYGVSAAMAAVENSNDLTQNIVPGWYVTRSGMGPISTITVSTPLAGPFANGETITFSNGSSNTSGVLSTNATGNITSISVSGNGGGLFANLATVAFKFDREKWISSLAVAAGQYLANVTVTGATANFTNTDYFIASNGYMSANVSVTTNSTGGITNASFTVGANGLNGLWSSATTNAQVKVVAFAANGAASNGTGATLGANITLGTILGYGNTDVIKFSNGVLNGTATVLTNTTGGFVTANITITNIGLFSNTTTASQIVFTPFAANGAASNGHSAVFTPTLANSAAGNVAVTLGGRAGRVAKECLVVLNSMTANSTYTTPMFPNT